MSDLLQPFSGFLPRSQFGARVVGPPGATLTGEQRETASNDPLSFRFTAGRKAGCSAEEALEWLSDGSKRDVLAEFEKSVVVYRQTSENLTSTGLIGDLSLDAYMGGQVKRHEKTIAKTQQKMAEYMRTTRVYGNPAVTAVDAGLTEVVENWIDRHPDSSFTTVDEISHELWVVGGQEGERLAHAVGPVAYITDGHHRLAAAALVATEEGHQDARIPVGVFSADQFRLRSFARCIFDPDLDQNRLIAKLRSAFEVEEVEARGTQPTSRFELGVRVGDTYFRLRVPIHLIPDDHYSALNTNLLQRLILGPVLGIDRPRLDNRLRFVPHLSDSDSDICPDADAWFLPFPLEPTDVMRVADSGQTMPAKSTWFAPKLPSGLVIRPLDQ